VGLVTVDQLILDAKRASDMENSAFVTDAEWLSYANREAAQVHAEFATLSEDYWINYVEFSLPSSGPGALPKNAFQLPDDFHKLRGLDYQIDATNTAWRALRKFTFAERNAMSPDIRRLFAFAPDRRYRIFRDAIWIIPETQPDGHYRMWYTTLFQPFVTTADSFPSWEGVHELVILGMAIRALQKEESLETAAQFGMEREALRERIRNAFTDRDESEADVIQDRQGIDVSPYGRWEPY
jgi:hypothetical protein